MELLTISFEHQGTQTTSNAGLKQAKCGVVGSGNLEIIVELNHSTQTLFTINTPVAHYEPLWQAVISDFVTEKQIIGLKFTLNDNAASPPVVALRLRQVLEVFHGYQSNKLIGYLDADARTRLYALSDKDTFDEWLPDPCYSPHLALLNMPSQADDGLIIGHATIDGHRVLLAAQQKDFMGGAVGEIHGAKLTGLFKAAQHLPIKAVILLIDSGGVRLHEANAGEIAISEAIRAALEARLAGCLTIGVVCGKQGSFGGMGILVASLDYIIVNETGRIGVSGAEVIEAVAGVDAFDAKDKALVWRVYGGRHRYIQQMAQAYVNTSINAIKNSIINALSIAHPVLNLSTLRRTQQQLKQRFSLLEMDDCTDFLNQEDEIRAQLSAKDDALFLENFECIGDSDSDESKS